MLVSIPLVFAMMESWPRSLRVFFAFVALLMASTIFLSRSLGGMVAFGAQMVILAVIVGLRERSRRQVLLLLLLGVLLTVWLVTLSPGGIRERIEGLHDPLGKAGAGDRLAIVKDSLKMVAPRPVIGWGLGTFPEIYPSFRSFYTNLLVNEAHNDFVQTLVETGIAGVFLVIVFLFLLYRGGLHSLDSWRQNPRASMVVA